MENLTVKEEHESPKDPKEPKDPKNSRGNPRDIKFELKRFSISI